MAPRWLALALAAAPVACGGGSEARDAGPDAASWRSLFDGSSFAGWQRYLGKPTVDEAPLGLENDPRGVFSVVTVDGGPAIRISGEVWGALISDESFCDLRLRADYKWGTEIWPPLNYRDSGIMYLSTGPLGAVNAGGPDLSNPPGSGGFMVSLEYQITPTDVGSMTGLGPITLTPLGRTVPTESAGWNHVEILVQAGVVTHRLEGVEVARGRDVTITWPEVTGDLPVPLACGKLQIQSEGAEIFFRNVEIQTP
jgi:3-keto-disaccharide hydrolase